MTRMFVSFLVTAAIETTEDFLIPSTPIADDNAMEYDDEPRDEFTECESLQVVPQKKARKPYQRRTPKLLQQQIVPGRVNKPFVIQAQLVLTSKTAETLRLYSL